MTNRENYLRAARFGHPEWIPSQVAVSDASWDQWRGEMERVAARYPEYFPRVHAGWRDYEHYRFAPACRKGERYTDAWGCQWVSAVNGLEGVVLGNPLADWDALSAWRAPDPETQADRGERDWAAEAASVARAKEAGELAMGGLAHGFLFLRLTYLRGFENAACDLMDGDERFDALFETVMAHNMAVVRHYIDLGVDVMSFPEDLGSQDGPLISPRLYAERFAPAYARLTQPCHDAGILTHFHSDGKTIDLLDAQIEAGADIVNPQDLANGVDELARRIKGRACIDLDIDRQRIVPFGTAREIDELIEYEVRTLGAPEGGLMMIAGIYPPTPPENVDALCAALRKYRSYFRDKR